MNGGLPFRYWPAHKLGNPVWETNALSTLGDVQHDTQKTDRHSIGGERETLMHRLERAIETIILQSRWLAAPFLLGLIAGLAALVYTFMNKLIAFVQLAQTGSEDEVIVGILKLVDLSLTANLLLIVIWSGYENFVARIDHGENKNRPEGLIGIGFSGLKQKLLASILAIAAVNVLEWFIDIDRSIDTTKLSWVVGILLALAVAMLLLAIADRLGEPHEKKS